MRQRITFLQEPNDAIDPKSLIVTRDSVDRKDIRAAREEKVTFAFEELPDELYEVVKKSYEVHIRWVSEKAYEGMGPLVSRLSPGLHVFYTPQGGNKGMFMDFLTPALKNVFGEIDCVSRQKSFTHLHPDRFSHHAREQYYTPLASLANFITYLGHLCTSPSYPDCHSRVSALKNASYIDINFDSISHALTLTSFHPESLQPLNITTHPESRLELGLLTIENPIETEELSLGGFLTVLGDPETPSPKPKATLFSFPSRHHSTPTTFSSTFLPPTGLHPTLQLSISSPTPPLEDRTCSLHAHLTLPKQIFLDRYQFTDPLFLTSKNLTALRYISTPVDLEAPAYTVSLWGSTVLLELLPPPQNEKWTTQIPLHLRYLLPSSHSSQTPLQIPYPVLFWACTADEGSKFPINPFDRVNLGYDGLFGPRTLFYHLSPKPEDGGKLVMGLTVPVLDLERAGWVESGTATVVLVGFVWVLWCLFGVWRRSGFGGKVIGKDSEKKTE